MKRYLPLALLVLLFAALDVRSRKTQPPDAPKPAFRARRKPHPRPATTAPAPAASERTDASPVEPEPEPEPTEDAVHAALKWLLHHQNEDGTWGDGPTTLDGHTLGPTGVTSLALLSFLGAGYSHLSKDTYDGKCIGDAIRKAAEWLMRDQRDGGTFRSSHDGRFDQALAALALSESYGLTGSNLFKDAAQSAVDGLLGMQGRDGSWGGPLPTVWAAEALFSAQVSGLEGLAQANQFLLRSFRTPPYGPDAREMFAKILLERNKEDPSLAGGSDLLLRNKPRWEEQDFSYWYHGSMALFQLHGPSGPKWKAWNEDMKNTLVKTQTREGTWPGGTLSNTVVRTSLAQMTLEVYYRMANVFGDK